MATVMEQVSGAQEVRRVQETVVEQVRRGQEVRRVQETVVEQLLAASGWGEARRVSGLRVDVRRSG